MIRVAIDSNILIYAEFEPDSEKGTRSADLILRAAHDGVISAQVLGEFLRFAQRRMPAAFDDAIRQALLYQAVFRRSCRTVHRGSAWRTAAQMRCSRNHCCGDT